MRGYARGDKPASGYAKREPGDWAKPITYFLCVRLCSRRLGRPCDGDNQNQSQDSQYFRGNRDHDNSRDSNRHVSSRDKRPNDSSRRRASGASVGGPSEPKPTRAPTKAELVYPVTHKPRQYNRGGADFIQDGVIFVGYDVIANQTPKQSNAVALIKALFRFFR